MNRTFLLLLTMVLLMLPVLTHYFGAHFGKVALWVEEINPEWIQENSWHQAISSTDRQKVLRAYSVLQKRRSAIAVADAIKDLQSPDDYLWVHATYYLATLKRPEAVPYLIKSLRHSVSSSDTQTVAFLEKLTNENHGRDFKKWRRWYLIQKDAIALDWDNHLGENPRIDSSSRNTMQASAIN